jgi:hypothetical protein
MRGNHNEGCLKKEWFAWSKIALIMKEKKPRIKYLKEKIRAKKHPVITNRFKITSCILDS